MQVTTNKPFQISQWKVTCDFFPRDLLFEAKHCKRSEQTTGGLAQAAEYLMALVARLALSLETQALLISSC